MTEFFESMRNWFGEIAGERIELGTNSVTTLNIIVWSLFIGFLIAIAVSVYHKLVLGSLISALVRGEVFTEDTACSAKELGCTSPLVRFALRKNGTFRRVVRMKGDTDAARCDNSFDEAKFYLPQENVRRAENLYGKSGLTAGNIILSIVAFLALAIVAFIVIPDLLQMLSNFIAGITPNDNII